MAAEENDEFFAIEFEVANPKVSIEVEDRNEPVDSNSIKVISAEMIMKLPSIGEDGSIYSAVRQVAVKIEVESPDFSGEITISDFESELNLGRVNLGPMEQG